MALAWIVVLHTMPIGPGMTTHYIQANTDGALHAANKPSITPLNRGFLYGDAIYEVWRTYHRVLFAFAEHWERLLRSATALHLDLPFGADALLEQIRRTVAAYRGQTGHSEDLYIRLQLTRGAGVIGLDPALADRASWVILVQALQQPPVVPGRRGLHLSVARELRRNSPDALNPAWKTGNYLNNMLCLREARSRGADEVVILNEHGAVSEAAVCNIFFVQGSELITPPLSSGILEGITRHVIIHEVAGRAGFVVHERPIRPEELDTFQECFLTSSTRDVAAVERIDEVNYPVGAETATARLKNAFRAYTADYARDHSALGM